MTDTIKSETLLSVDHYEFKPNPIKGYPELWWRGKKPFTSTRFYPAQLKESHGKSVEGPDGKDWRNKIFWGDNLQVMSHLLKEFRGKVDLIYIDPPFDSKADYGKKIQTKGQFAIGDSSAFEEKQYSDIWSNDEYLQFMYERLIVARELISPGGFIFLHCDHHKSHYIKLIMDQVFGLNNFRNEITWVRSTNPKGSQHKSKGLDVFTDSILAYSKSDNSELFQDKIRVPLTEEELKEKYFRSDEKGRYYDGPIVSSITMGERPNLVYEYGGYTPPASGWRVSREKLEAVNRNGNLGWTKTGTPFRKLRPEDDKGRPIGNFWSDISLINSQSSERVGYPTQKPIALLERVITLASEPGALVLDFFMGSGTTQAAAMKLGRRFIGADINLGAVQTTTKRLIRLADELIRQQPKLDEELPTYYTGFEIYNVNNYDIFRNPVQARELLIEALEINKFPAGNLFDGEKDGRLVKIMPVNRIATRADLNDLLSGFDYAEFGKRKLEHPSRPVEKITLVCMGHEPDLKAQLQKQVGDYKLDIEVVDILRDRQDLQFKRDSEAEIVVENGELIIKQFYPLNLLQKLSLQQENVTDWREMVESVMIDWNYDGAVITEPAVDIPDKKSLVKGRYKVPQGASNIRVKITDLLSESLEIDVPHD